MQIDLILIACVLVPRGALSGQATGCMIMNATQQPLRTRVANLIINRLAFPLATQEAMRLHHVEMLADGVVGDAQMLGDLVNLLLDPFFKEAIENAQGA